MKITLSNGSIVEGTNEELSNMVQFLCQPSASPQGTRRVIHRRKAKQKLSPSHRDEMVAFIKENAEELGSVNRVNAAKKLNRMGKRTAFGHRWTSKSFYNFVHRNGIQL
jgi:hypothetical protein